MAVPDNSSFVASIAARYGGYFGVRHLALYRLRRARQQHADPALHFSSPNGVYDDFNATIPSFSYLDLEVTWNAKKLLQIRAGATNVLDKDPPIIDNNIVGGGAANTYDAYDLFGRQLFVAFPAKF